MGNRLADQLVRLVVLLVLVAIGAPSVAVPTASDLCCEWRVGNEAVGDICPEFYWEAEGQRARQVLVATSEDRLAPGQADAWDSDKVDSRLPIIEYAGEPLANQATYLWKVRLWGEEDQPGPWSEVQRFTTSFEPRPALRPHMRYFVNFGGADAELMASRYDLSFRPEPNEIRPEYIAVHYCLMATMVIPSPKHDDLAAWCAQQGLGDEVPEEMFCHFRTDRDVTLHVRAERAGNPRETRTIPGWDPRNDLNGDGKVDDAESADLVNPDAHGRDMEQARIPVYYWGPPRDDYVMNIGHPDYQRYLAEKYMPDQLEGGYDGFFVDTTPSDVPGAGRSADVLEYPRGPGEEDAWMRDMQSAMARVKINRPDSVLTANGWSADPFVLDGMERENWLNVTIGGSGLEARLRQVAELDRRGKIQLVQYNPIYEPERSEFGPKVPISLERDAMFGLAAYYLCAGEYTYYGYGRHGYAQALSWYNRAADLDVGNPEGPYERIVISPAGEMEGENLLPNGSFELDDDRDGLPDGWQVAPPLAFDEQVVRSGKRSVRIDSDNVQINNINRLYVTLKPNTAYTVSAWMKTEDIRAGAGAQVYVYEFEDAQTGGITMVLHGTNDWTRLSQIFRTGQDVEGRLNFRVYGSTGRAWFDDFALVEGAHADVVLLARRYSNALVIVRPSAPAIGWGDDTAIGHDLEGTYRPLQPDGTLGEPLQRISLRLGEAAILILAE